MKKQLKKAKLIIITVSITVIIVLIGFLIYMKIKSRNSPPEIISEGSLTKMLEKSELSTFQSTYNGIAEVYDSKKKDRIDYYVAYEATYLAGIDFEQVKIDIDEEKTLVTVMLPPIEITDIIIDFDTLEYMFYDDKANQLGVSAQAQKKCIEDIEQELKEGNNAIYELAEENAQNIIKALINPFIEQLSDTYQLEINVEGESK